MPALTNTVTSARLLAGGADLTFAARAGGVEVKVPAEAPDKFSSTVVLTIKGLIGAAPGAPSGAGGW